MEKAIMMKSAFVLLVLATAELFFTFIYFHYAKDNCLIGREYSEIQRAAKETCSEPAFRRARSGSSGCLDSALCTWAGVEIAVLIK